MPPEDSLNPQQERWYLRKEELKQQLTPAELELLYAESERKVLKKGELLFFDEAQPGVYFLDQGFAGLCKTDEEGKKFFLSVFAPGEIFGQIVPGLASETTDEDYLEAIRDVRIIQIRPQVFHQVMQSHPELLLRLVRLMDNRYRFLQKRLTQMLFKDVTARTVEFLLEICQKLGQPCPYDPAQIRDIQLTHQEIADIVGAARPVVSAVLSDLTKAGYCRKHDRVLCLTHLPALENIAEHGAKALGRSSQ